MVTVSRGIPDLRDHPVIAIMVGFAVLAAIAVPSLLLFAQPSDGPAGSDRVEASAPPEPRPGDQSDAEGDLTVGAAQPVGDVASDVVSQDEAFPGYRAQLLTMAAQVDESAPVGDDEDAAGTDRDEDGQTDAEAAASGWVEVYALTPEDAPERKQGEPPTQQQIGILGRTAEGGVRTRQIVGEDLERDQPQQIVAASYDAGAVVWQETPSTDAGSLPFVMYAWSTSSGETVELSRSEQVDGADAPPVPGFTGPVLRGGVVIWSQVAGSSAGSQRTDVLGCQIEDCRPGVVRQDAAYPTGGPAGFAVLARGSQNGRVALVEIDGDLEPVGEPRQLPASVGTVTGFAGSEAGYVLLEAPRGEPTRAVLFESADDAEPRVVVGPPAGGFVYAVADLRLMAWGFAGAAQEPVGGYAFDRATGQLMSLGDTSSRYGVAVAQGRVAYQVAEEAPDGLPGQRVALLP